MVRIGGRDEIGVLVAALQAPGGEEVDHHHVVRAAQIGQVQGAVTVQMGEGQVGNHRADDRGCAPAGAVPEPGCEHGYGQADDHQPGH